MYLYVDNATISILKIKTESESFWSILTKYENIFVFYKYSINLGEIAVLAFRSLCTILLFQPQ